MKKLTILSLVILTTATLFAEEYKQNGKPPTDGLIGSNYTPAYAVNQIQFWHDFRADVVEKELAAANKYFGMTSLRVFIHDINYFQDKENLMKNIEKFLVIADKHNIKPGFVFFDSCHRDEGIFLTKPTEPVKGYHNSRWAQSPQKRDIDENNLEKFKPFIQGIIKPYANDKRILFWEVHNEPQPGSKLRDDLKRAGYKWAKELKPSQPILNCEKTKDGWADCEVTDIISAHTYGAARKDMDKLADYNSKKGTVITEAGARWKAWRRNFGEPTCFILWLNQRKKDNKSTPGLYLCWELMVGNSNCRWHWVDNGYKKGKPDPEPEIPWCGMLWPDATPVSLTEAEIIRKYTTGKSQALFLDTFRESPNTWTLTGERDTTARNSYGLMKNSTATSGDPKWTDYVFEGRVAIKQNGKKNIGKGGFLIRATGAGDTLKAYSIKQGNGKLVLEKIVNGKTKELKTFDLTTLDTKSRVNAWCMVRVAAEGPRIRVWFNRMHPSADKDRGLRIDYTDKSEPILAGGIGLTTDTVRSHFNNVIVLPTTIDGL